MADDTDVAIEGSALVVDGDEIEINQPVDEFVVWNHDLIVVRFGAPAESTCDRNVIAIKRDGTEAWRVREPSRPPAHDSNPFVFIYERDEELWGHCYWGPEYRIGPCTGGPPRQ